MLSMRVVFFSPFSLTFVVVDVVVAVALQLGVAVQTVPPVGAFALPHVVGIDLALAVSRTSVRASLKGAVFSVPSGDAQTSAVLALAVFVAAVVTQFRVAILTGPSGMAAAGVAHAVAVCTAVQVAEF